MENPNPNPAAAAQPATAQPATAQPQAPAVIYPEGRVDPNATINPTRADIIAGERERIRQIFALPEAQGREQLARMLALETASDVEAARKILNAAPLATAQPARTTFEGEMGRLRNPQVGPASGEGTAQDEARSILSFVQKERRIAG